MLFRQCLKGVKYKGVLCAFLGSQESTTVQGGGGAEERDSESEWGERDSGLGCGDQGVSGRGERLGGPRTAAPGAGGRDGGSGKDQVLLQNPRKHT